MLVIEKDILQNGMVMVPNLFLKRCVNPLLSICSDKLEEELKIVFRFIGLRVFFNVTVFGLFISSDVFL